MGETEYMSDRCAEEIMKTGNLMYEALLELKEWVEANICNDGLIDGEDLLAKLDEMIQESSGV